jgi:hypothetical protein
MLHTLRTAWLRMSLCMRMHVWEIKTNLRAAYMIC